jgi:tetratricopeptide (TPR) repeat protein
MARLTLCAALGVALLLAIVPFFFAGPPEDDQRRQQQLDNDLAVVGALAKGRTFLQSGNYEAAVYALEREVARCHGAEDYIAALEAAYRGYVRELQQRRADPALVQKYADRLAKLDPGSCLDRPAPALAAITATTQPGPKAPAKPAEKPPAEVRGAYDYKAAPAPELDPFSDANRAAPLDVRAVLTRADQEFKQKHYQSASRLYQQANTLDGNAAAPCKECWAYCKMHAVVEALNQPELTPAAAEELAREVRTAMAMSEKLEPYGQSLLKQLKDRGPSATPGVTEGPGAPPAAARVEEAKFEMRHAGTQGQWSVLETANFRVLHNQPRETAEKAAKILEQTRLAMSKKWFGDGGEAWNQRCTLYLHATGEDYSRATPAPPSSPGHSTVNKDPDNPARIVSRRIDIHCDDPNAMIGVLPHETTHAVIAGRYGPYDVPRWADEGVAVLTEPRDRVERHLRNLPKHRDDGVLFRCGQLMEMKDYPKPQYIGPFYAQSVSLVEYLSSLKGPQEFTAFLRDGLRGGYEPSLKKHFGIDGYADLDRRWNAYAFGQQSASAESPR